MPKHLLTEEQHIPILRYLSRELGAYDGTTNREKYLVDAVSDIYVDWRVIHQMTYLRLYGANNYRSPNG